MKVKNSNEQLKKTKKKKEKNNLFIDIMNKIHNKTIFQKKDDINLNKLFHYST